MVLVPLLLAGQACAAALTIGKFGQLASTCGPSVAPSTLAALSKAESGFQPFAINDNTAAKSATLETQERAASLASKLLAEGHSIDVGIMQLNSSNLQKLGLTLEAAFDPCRSIAAAAKILAADYAGGQKTHARQQSTLRAAISRYNTGDARRGFENGYVHKVELAAQYVVPALDVSTPSAASDLSSPRQPVSMVESDAPPSWDVWASFDYVATQPEKSQSRAPSMLENSLVTARSKADHGRSASTDILALN